MTIDYVLILTSVLTFGVPIVFQYVSKILSPYKCLVITNEHDKQALQSNLLSDRYILVDLDGEIRKVLTNEQRQEKPLTVGSEVINVLPSSYYGCGPQVLDNLSKVIKNKEIILMSSDYMLLKSLARTSITYTVPSSSYLTFLKGVAGDNIECINNSINILKTNKSKKLNVYNSIEVLENFLINTFKDFSRKY